MTLDQFARLKAWHLHHRDRKPLEKHVWDAVLTAWVMAWVGMPAALLIGLPLAADAAVAVTLFLPGSYIALRARLHTRRQLRCDWLVALR